MKKIQRFIMFICMFIFVTLGQALGQVPAIICPSDTTITNDQDYTDTDITGFATAFNIDGEVDVEFADIIINLDANNNGFVTRRFNVVDYPDIFCDQIITVGNNDNMGPILVVQDVTSNIDPWSCTATIEIPQPLQLQDDCTTPPTYSVSGPSDITIIGDAITGYTALGVPVGVHTFTYSATDCFGNITSLSVLFTVFDGIPAVVVAKQNIVISLTSNGTNTNGLAKIYAESIDNGSYDGCSDIKLEIRKDQDNYICDNIGNATYNDDGHPYDGSSDPNSPHYDPDGGAYVTFSCADASNATIDIDGDGIVDAGYVRVWLRVWDDADSDGVFGTEDDNYNETWTFVKVENSVIVDESQIIYLGLHEANNAELTADMLTYLVSDDCDQFSATFSQSSFSEEGTYSVDYTFSDQYNNSSTGTVTVIVLAANGINCNADVNVTLDGEGEAIISPDMILEGALFANVDYTVSINGGPYNNYGILNCSHIGVNQVSIRDENTNNICWSNMVIEDKLPPVIDISSQILLSLNGESEVELTSEMLAPYTFDNCGIVSHNFSQSIFSNEGSYAVNYTVTDLSGLSTSQDLEIQVTQGSAPMVCNGVLELNLDKAGSTIIDAHTQLAYIYLNYDFQVGVAPTGEDITEYQNELMLDCSDLGSNDIEVIDPATGNSCYGVLIINDVHAPTPFAKSSIIVTLEDNEPYVLMPSQLDESSFDNCTSAEDLVMTVTPNTFTFPGTYKVKLKVFDESGNSDFAISTVIVEGEGGQAIECVSTSTALTNNFGPTTLYAEDLVLDPFAYDNFTMSTEVNGTYTETIDFDCSEYPTNNPFPIYVKGENNEGTSTCLVLLTLQDNTPPIPVVQNSIIIQLVNGQATLTPEEVDEGSYDLCGDVSFSLSKTLFTSADLGSNFITLTVIDNSGNINTALTEVIVTDDSNNNPCDLNYVIFPEDITILDENGTIENLSIENLQSVYNYDYEEVHPYTVADCDQLAYSYEDIVLPGSQLIKVVRTFSALDWATSNITTKTQLISLVQNENPPLICITDLAINVNNGSVQLFPQDVLSGNYDFTNIELTITFNGNEVINNVITPNFAGQTLIYEVVDSSTGNTCIGTIEVISDENGCPLDVDEDVSFPLESIFLANANIDASEYSPENLVANYGFEEEDVNIIIDSDCAIAAFVYEDVVIDLIGGNYKILRTFTILDWISFDQISNTGIYTFEQTINVGIDPNSLICDVLPNSAPVGDCDTGHTLEDDVEWPSDLEVSDYNITPEDLITISGIPEQDAMPIFFNTPDDYTATYTDLLTDLNPTTLTIERVWKAVNNTYNITWNYSQTIEVDFTEFQNLVSINTATDRVVPGVIINDSFMTNEDGEAQVPEEIISIDFEDDARNGINVRDIILMQRHILGVEGLDEKLIIAGDVNDNNMLTANDLLEVARRAVGLSNKTEWRFINTQSSTNPILQPKGVYTAYKIGDLDDSAILPGETEEATSKIEIEDRVLNNGETYIIPIIVEDANLLMGVDIRMNLNTDLIDTNSINIINHLTFEANIYHVMPDGEMTIQLLNIIDPADITQSTDNAVVYMEFTANANTLLSQAISFENKFSYIVDEEINLTTLAVEIGNKITGNNSPELVSINVYPNPTSDYLSIDMNDVSVKGDLTINIINSQGQNLITQSSSIVDVKSLSPGVYYYDIKIGAYEKKGKFLVVR